MTWRLERDVSGFLVRRSPEATKRYEAAGYWRDRTLADVARAPTPQDPSRTLIVEGDRRVTPRETRGEARRPGAFFSSPRPRGGPAAPVPLPPRRAAAVV